MIMNDDLASKFCDFYFHILFTVQFRCDRKSGVLNCLGNLYWEIICATSNLIVGTEGLPVLLLLLLLFNRFKNGVRIEGTWQSEA